MPTLTPRHLTAIREKLFTDQLEQRTATHAAEVRGLLSSHELRHHFGRPLLSLVFLPHHDTSMSGSEYLY
ncbi:hypothetical protein [Marinobacter adhaerens]|uniref:hypothetical protein n=1 Tax=Marinobacter adhaerens TaxID=1033846 RepID=UPI003F72475B